MNNSPNLTDRRRSCDIRSGVIKINGNIVEWEVGDSMLIKMDLDDIAVIGEYTDYSGPWFDDWYIVLVNKKGVWHSFPWYAGDIEKLSDELLKRYKLDISFSLLTNSTVWKSMVRYPRKIEGRELFKLQKVPNYKGPKLWFNKFLYYGFGIGKFETTTNIFLSDDVIAEVKKAGA